MKGLVALTATVLLLAVSTTTALAGEDRFSLSVRVGAFVPQDWQIQGTEFVSYAPSGSPATAANVSGFGTGGEIVVAAGFDFSGYTVKLGSGVRTLLGRKADVAFIASTDHYENRLIIIPVTASLVRKVKISGSQVVPYAGIGAGLYISSWEEKFSREALEFEREWLKGSDVSFGGYFLAGFNYPVVKSLLAEIELRYSFIPSSWELEDQDTGAVTEWHDVNLGGTSLTFGLGYRF